MKIQMIMVTSNKRIAMLHLALQAEKRVKKRTRLVKDLKVKVAIKTRRAKMLRKRKRLQFKLGDLLASFAKRLSKIMAH